MQIVRINPVKLNGHWRQGYALDRHTLWSRFIGYNEFGHAIYDTKHSEIGELLYRFKYKSDKTVLDSIIEAAANFIASWNPGIALIVPVPPSKQRTFQPVLELAKHLSARLNIPLCKDCIVKLRGTPELKNVDNYGKRKEMLENSFDAIPTAVKGQSVLLFDDLYQSGATLNAITDILYNRGEAANVYVLVLTKTRRA